MDTVEFADHMSRVGKDLMRTAERAWQAASHKLKGPDREAAISMAREKLAQYDAVDALLAQDSKVLQGQFAESFEDDIGLIRDSLARIDAESKPGNEP